MLTQVEEKAKIDKVNLAPDASFILSIDKFSNGEMICYGNKTAKVRG